MPKPDLNLTHIVSFSEVAKYGSLIKAAARSTISEATLSRHVKSLERALNLNLFERSANQLSLTKAGTELLVFAKNILDASSRFEFEASCRAHKQDENVRIAVSEGFSFSAFPPILLLCHEMFPRVCTELIITDEPVDLLSGEADLAFRTAHPLDQSLKACFIFEHNVGAFASNDYIKRHGEPKALEELPQHIVIGGYSSDEVLRGFHALGYEFDNNLFKIRCDNRALAWQLVRSGLGIGFSNVDTGASAPGVKRLFPSYPEIRREIWLTTRASLPNDSVAGKIYEFIRDTMSRTIQAQMQPDGDGTPRVV